MQVGRRCDICGGRTDSQDPSVTTCRSPSCRFAHARQARDLEERSRVAARDAALSWFSAAGLNVMGDTPDPVCVVPFNARRLVSGDPARVALFRASLAAAAEAAISAAAAPTAAGHDPGTTSDEREEAPGLGDACGACGGLCCEMGGTHAFLTGDELARRLRQSPPSRSAADLVEDYVARLPARSYEGSCVFHAEQGCNLPRSARSQVCNTYSCRGLNHVVAALDLGRPADVHVAAVRDARVRRTASIAKRPADPPEAGGDAPAGDARPATEVRAGPGLPPGRGQD